MYEVSNLLKDLSNWLCPQQQPWTTGRGEMIIALLLAVAIKAKQMRIKCKIPIVWLTSCKTPKFHI
jgi:hypothetical protein